MSLNRFRGIYTFPIVVHEQHRISVSANKGRILKGEQSEGTSNHDNGRGRDSSFSQTREIVIVLPMSNSCIIYYILGQPQLSRAVDFESYYYSISLYQKINLAVPVTDGYFE
jgi:hypothetical protein